MAWTQHDTQALQEMIAKAKECGVWDHVVPVHSSPPCSEFTVLATPRESMTDASKRRAVEELEDLQQPFLPGNMGAGRVNRKSKSQEQQHATPAEIKKMNTGYLPDGVSDFATWGRTCIMHGKYEGKGMSYLTLARSQDPEHIQYKQWCTRRVKSATGLSKDLTDYLIEYERMISQSYGSSSAAIPFIPGTDRTRVLLDE